MLQEQKLHNESCHDTHACSTQATWRAHTTEALSDKEPAISVCRWHLASVQTPATNDAYVCMFSSFLQTLAFWDATPTSKVPSSTLLFYFPGKQTPCCTSSSNGHVCSSSNQCQKTL